MRKERQITINVIENKNINDYRLIQFFAKKYREKDTNKES